MSFSDDYEGQTVELRNYVDSTLLGEVVINNGKASFILDSESSTKLPVLANLQIEGHNKGLYILEAGKANFDDKNSCATGTPLNDRFSSLLIQLDSIENLDDLKKYTDFTQAVYKTNVENPIGDYFFIESLKYINPDQIDGLLSDARPDLRESGKVKHFEKFARLRAKTSPGKKFVNFEGESDTGEKINLSDYVVPGKYTLIDFWASWCPYCIKELPDLKKIQEKFDPKDFQIVGVAVRDEVDDTSLAVIEHGISWPIIFNTQKVPYDLYGFSGIPHHILVGPDGIIISRGESVTEIQQYLETKIAK